MKNRILLFLCLAGTFITNTQAQENNNTKKGRLKFTSEAIDFGTIQEKDGIASRRYTAYNPSQYPVKILTVHPSCGCTAADWTKGTIEPGDSAFIDVSYDPAGRPGPFEKALNVTTDGVPFQFFLVMKGDVIARPRTKEDDFPAKFGNLVMDKSYYDFGFMYMDEVDTIKAKIYNPSYATINIKGITGRPNYIITSLSKLTLEPKTESELTIVVNAKALNDYGDYIINMDLLTDNQGVLPIELYVKVHIMEKFKPMSAKKAKKAPKTTFDTEMHHFGKVLQGDSVVLYYKLTNAGGSDLIIRKLQPSCGCAATTIEKNVVKKGETVTIRVVFNTSGRMGEEEKTITVITNDPARPIAKLVLSGEIITNPNALQDY